MSSIGGVNAFPNLGIYHSSTWPLEGFSQSLAMLHGEHQKRLDEWDAHTSLSERAQLTRGELTIAVVVGTTRPGRRARPSQDECWPNAKARHQQL